MIKFLLFLLISFSLSAEIRVYLLSVDEKGKNRVISVDEEGRSQTLYISRGSEKFLFDHNTLQAYLEDPPKNEMVYLSFKEGRMIHGPERQGRKKPLKEYLGGFQLEVEHPVHKKLFYYYEYSGSFRNNYIELPESGEYIEFEESLTSLVWLNDTEIAARGEKGFYLINTLNGKYQYYGNRFLGAGQNLYAVQDGDFLLLKKREDHSLVYRVQGPVERVFIQEPVLIRIYGKNNLVAEDLKGKRVLLRWQGDFSGFLGLEYQKIVPEDFSRITDPESFRSLSPEGKITLYMEQYARAHWWQEEILKESHLIIPVLKKEMSELTLSGEKSHMLHLSRLIVVMAQRNKLTAEDQHWFADLYEEKIEMYLRELGVLDMTVAVFDHIRETVLSPDSLPVFRGSEGRYLYRKYTLKGFFGLKLSPSLEFSDSAEFQKEFSESP